MLEGLLYLVTSFWLGAVHAATPGHGKTIAASYIVGVRGRPVDALVLGIFVTLSHTSGIVLVAVLATLGSAALIPQRVEAYLGAFTGFLVIGIGGFMLRTQVRALVVALADRPNEGADTAAPHDGHDHAHGESAHEHHVRHHSHPHGVDEHGMHMHRPGDPGLPRHAPHYHSHGWGRVHTHDIEAIAQARPSLAMLLGLSIAGGLLPDPAALAILLAAIASGKVILGLFTVLVFSLGFASVLLVVGVVAAHMGQLILTWLGSRWIAWIQIGAALLIVGVGLVLTANALRVVAALR
jgi:nickel/cobalt transporter (NicO) family protein